MIKTFFKYRFLNILWIFLVVVFNCITITQAQLSQKTSVEHHQTEQEETVSKKLSYEAVVPLFQVDFQQDFDVSKPFVWNISKEKEKVLVQEYIHLLSYFVNLFSTTICINAP